MIQCGKLFFIAVLSLSLMAKVAEMNWDKTTYVRTPALHYADMRDLHSLPAAELRVMLKPGNNVGEADVEIHNAGRTIAFFCRVACGQDWHGRRYRAHLLE
jgi:hypothetical protein